VDLTVRSPSGVMIQDIKPNRNASVSLTTRFSAIYQVTMTLEDSRYNMPSTCTVSWNSNHYAPPMAVPAP